MTFPVYDGLLFSGKPSTASLGLLPITVVYQQSIIPDGVLPDDSTIDGLAATYNAAGLPVSIDIESWDPTDESTVTDKYLPLVSRLYSGLNVDVGYYNILPSHHAGLTVESDNPQTRAAFIAAQDDLPQSQLFPYFDMVTKPFYRWDADIWTWIKRVRGWAAVTRTVKPGAPLIPFVWFNFHNSMAPAELQNTEIPRAEWRLMLEVVRQICDGCILWGGYQTEWDGEAEWWAETQDWLAKYT